MSATAEQQALIGGKAVVVEHEAAVVLRKIPRVDLPGQLAWPMGAAGLA